MAFSIPEAQAVGIVIDHFPVGLLEEKDPTEAASHCRGVITLDAVFKLSVVANKSIWLARTNENPVANLPGIGFTVDSEPPSEQRLKRVLERSL